MRVHLFAISGLFWSLNAAAIPFEGNSCSAIGSKIKHAKNSSEIIFDEDCKTAYVLAPQTGEAELSGLVPNANVGFCKAVMGNTVMTEHLMKGMQSLSAHIVSMIEDYQPQKKELETQRKEISNKEADLNILKDKLSRAQIKLDQLEEESSSARSEYKKCMRDYETPEELQANCNKKKAAADSLWSEFKNYDRETFSPLADETSEKNHRLKAEKRKLSLASTEMAEKLEPLARLQGQLDDLFNRYLERYQKFSALHAATGNIVFKVKWNNLVEEYRELNKDLNVYFTRVPLVDARVISSSYLDSSGGQELGFPSLLKAEIPGEKINLLVDQEGDIKIDPQNEDIIGQQTKKPVVLAFGEASVGAHIALSALAACPAFPEGDYKNPDHKILANMKNYMKVQAFYTYPTKLRRKYNASYNIHQFVKKVSKKSKRRGFLSSKNVSSLVEDGDSKDWFKIEFDQSSVYGYSSEEQTKITNEVKANLIERAMRQFAMIAGSSEVKAPEMPELPAQSGYYGLGVRRYCTWGWCYGANYFTTLVQDVFGSRSSESILQRTHDVWVQDSVSQSTVMERNTSLTFE